MGTRILTVAALLAVLVASPLRVNAADVATPSLENRVKALELEVASLLKAQEAAHPTPEAASPSPPLTTATTSKTSVESGRLKVTKWDYASRDGSYGRKFYHISYSLLNGYDKPIKLLKASLHFEDLLGEHVYGIHLEQDVHLVPGQESTFQNDYARNQFEASEQRLAGIQKSDVVVKLVVQSIVFSDNTVLNIQ